MQSRPGLQRPGEVGAGRDIAAVAESQLLVLHRRQAGDEAPVAELVAAPGQIALHRLLGCLDLRGRITPEQPG
ncbi:hypothetical protein [Paractinoplanes durhamensis]|uniref:hypothetical protein n=1 Tax=Paractinoplanes durhamensis TaxID=113563 RepID=UPI0019449291|nr:hypothetical protein [Actinoplanes durhamensis]